MFAPSCVVDECPHHSSSLIYLCQTLPCFHPQPPPDHSTVWTDSAKKTGLHMEAELSIPNFHKHLPLFSRAVHIGPRSSRVDPTIETGCDCWSTATRFRCADSSDVSCQNADRGDRELMFQLLCLMTGRGRPRQANAVYRVASLLPSFFLQNFQDISHLRKRLPGATRGKPMQSSAWPPTEQHCISNCARRLLEARQCSLPSNLHLRKTLHLQPWVEVTRGEPMQSSAWPSTQTNIPSSTAA